MKKSAAFFEPLEKPPYYFIGREKELESLDRAFFKDKAKVVGVIGKVGVGKTALILEFARQQKNKFLGGAYHFPQISSIDILNTSLEFIRESNRPILLIIEEFGALSDTSIRYLLSVILNRRPLAKILFTSQRFISVSVDNLVDRTIELDLEDSERIEHLKRRADGFKLNIDDSGFISTEPFARPGIIGPDGHPLIKSSKLYRQIVTEISEVSDELIIRLSQNPELLYELSPRKFEEVIAEILHRQGYEVAITPLSKDGGKDICAASKSTLGSFLYIVQCKKYAPNRPVGVELVRELYGIVQIEKATAGIIATTSYFTKGAKDLQNQLLYQISLKDYIGVQEWLKSIQSRDVSQDVMGPS